MGAFTRLAFCSVGLLGNARFTVDLDVGRAPGISATYFARSGSATLSGGEY